MGKLNEPLAALLKNCSLPLALEAMGERWSFMILRASFNGLKHFEEFQQTLGIARNILANRLGRLVDHGILVREPMEQDRRKVEYRLTDKGAALLPALVALRQWGETYGAGTRTNHPVLVDQRDHRPIQPVRIFAEDGRPLELDDLMWISAEDLAQHGTAARPPKAANG